MPTPPSSSSSSSRSKLPSSSPSSARLRRIAPSPVKIPAINQTSPITTKIQTASLLSDITASLPQEYEFAPLELIILSSPDTQIRTLFEVLESSRTGRRRKSIEGDDKLPLIFDSRGEFGKLAHEARIRKYGIDVPCSPVLSCFEGEGKDESVKSEESSPNKKRRTSNTTNFNCEENGANDTKELHSLTPTNDNLSLKLKYDIPSPIMIDFKEDIFSEKGRNQIWLDEIPKESTTRQIMMRRPGRVDREDSSRSINTFGHNPSNAGPAIESNGDWKSDGLEEELDNWSFTLSAYEDEESIVGGISTDRKDSFFASFGSSNSTIDLTLINTPSTLNISFDNEPTMTMTTSNDKFLSSSSYMPPPTTTTATRFNFSSMVQSDEADQNSLEFNNSPFSDTIVIPLCTARDNVSQLLLSVDHDQVDDTPTPKNKTATHSSKGRARVISSDKELPALPILHRNQHTFQQLEVDGASCKTDGPRRSLDIEGDPVELALKEVDKSMTIQLWVDQEGCRENRSSLKFIRSIKPNVFREREEKALKEAALWCESPTRPECFQQSGCWEFGMDPKERDKWSFHHAALEGLPVLRRLTINNDEKHDFLSRSATLQIKEPGVYSVCGQEERGKAEWKFEYLVQNEISPNSREQIANERIIIPLGLYVSPNFFNPDRALKTSLLNLFKKTLASNIMSEKIRPPHIGKPPAPPSAATAISEKEGITMTTVKSELALIQHRKRSQTQSHIPTIGAVSSNNVTPSHPHPHAHGHSRSVSRTIGAIAKAVAGMTNTTPTPTHQINHDIAFGKSPTPNSSSGKPGSSGVGMGIHKFGTKPATFGRSTLGSRSKTPTGANAVFDNAPDQENGLTPSAEEKKKNRKRWTSLFSRSRPFTPPVNITELHPIPILSNTAIKPSTPTSMGPSGLLIPLDNNNQTSISLPLQQNKGISSSRPNRLSQLQPQQGHPFLQPISPSRITTTSTNTMTNGQSLLTRSSSITSRSKPINHNYTHSNSQLSHDTLCSLPGSSNTRRGIRKRPSTAEPRLGMR
ncbi:hypothetical protein L486_01709 [Kwoniella mangroviensis CBS 10435]|uniref:Uncharacterized protein n=1 Tax=Kwoniella mangroviensis CBS 10435 TaxID=1331196 RepID=A0A1B9J2M8_9TREE|nr:hypothetical protein L486_01709 [Kwoniella mangroviensis CBS 10435]